MAKAPDRVSLPFVVAFLAAGLLSIAVGAAVGLSTWHELASARRAEGTVVELVHLAAGKGLSELWQPWRIGAEGVGGCHKPV